MAVPALVLISNRAFLAELGFRATRPGESIFLHELREFRVYGLGYSVGFRVQPLLEVWGQVLMAESLSATPIGQG